MQVNNDGKKYDYSNLRSAADVQDALKKIQAEANSTKAVKQAQIEELRSKVDELGLGNIRFSKGGNTETMDNGLTMLSNTAADKGPSNSVSDAIWQGNLEGMIKEMGDSQDVAAQQAGGAGPAADVDVAPQAEAGAGAEVEAGQENQAGPQVEADPEAEPETEVGPEIEAEPQSKAQAPANAGTGPTALTSSAIQTASAGGNFSLDDLRKNARAAGFDTDPNNKKAAKTLTDYAVQQYTATLNMSPPATAEQIGKSMADVYTAYNGDGKHVKGTTQDFVGMLSKSIDASNLSAADKQTVRDAVNARYPYDRTVTQSEHAEYNPALF